MLGLAPLGRGARRQIRTPSLPPAGKGLPSALPAAALPTAGLRSFMASFHGVFSRRPFKPNGMLMRFSLCVLYVSAFGTLHSVHDGIFHYMQCTQGRLTLCAVYMGVSRYV